ncbi:phosphoglycolate phosphatase [Limimonas halophila]|uniref:Phosphoglycolate phosphatase n=1 Tax=Limimonas halophila TaxID=1082479 RepID=A0A1G7QRL5_9PROT|nr:phosphoglycolate phosphatase [Limimonas halophila]SDG01171.1 phosphoglycolate phosphatase [Limimonas halophila]
MRRAVLCDLDGTLVDTVADLAAALNGLLAELGYPALSRRRIRRFVGGGAVGLVSGGLAEVGHAPADEEARQRLVARFLELYAAAPAAHSRPFPGVADTLAALAADGWRLAVCTNKPQHLAERILADLDLDRHFGAVVGGDSVPAKKPDAGHIRTTLDALDVPHQGGVLVGDSRTDRLAARNAEIPVVLVTYGYTEMPVTGMGAARVIGSFDTLPAVLDGRNLGVGMVRQWQ